MTMTKDQSIGVSYFFNEGVDGVPLDTDHKTVDNEGWIGLKCRTLLYFSQLFTTINLAQVRLQLTMLLSSIGPKRRGKGFTVSASQKEDNGQSYARLRPLRLL